MAAEPELAVQRPDQLRRPDHGQVAAFGGQPQPLRRSLKTPDRGVRDQHLHLRTTYPLAIGGARQRHRPPVGQLGGETPGERVCSAAALNRACSRSRRSNAADAHVTDTGPCAELKITNRSADPVTRNSGSARS
ncbi:hypothetical protein HerbRD11066_68100 [Herbidospora sp. RD11066]